MSLRPPVFSATRREDQTADTSADEADPIISREHGGARNYQTSRASLSRRSSGVSPGSRDPIQAKQSLSPSNQPMDGKHESGESADSGSGYVSGSGRRYSVISTRKSSARGTTRRDGEPNEEELTGPGQRMLSSSYGSNTRLGTSPASASPGRIPASRGSREQVRQRVNIPNTLGQDSMSSPGRRKVARRSKKGNKVDRGGTGGDGIFDKEDSFAWLKSILDKYGAVELDNKGSVARDHLALERTFLAWLRTSLAFASIGIAVTQLFRLNTSLQSPDPDNPVARLRHLGKPLGTTFLAVAIVILIIGWRRYFESQYWIIRGKFPASRGSVFIVTLVSAGLIVASLVVVVLVGGNSSQTT